MATPPSTQPTQSQFPRPFPPAGTAAQDPATPVSADRSASLHDELRTAPNPRVSGVSLPPPSPPQSSSSRLAATAQRVCPPAGADPAGSGIATQGSTAAHLPSAGGGCSGGSRCSTSDDASSRFESINRVAAVAGKEFVTRRSGEREQRRSEELRKLAAAKAAASQKPGLEPGWQAHIAALHGSGKGRRPAAEQAAPKAIEWSPSPPALPVARSTKLPSAAATAPLLASMAAEAAARAAGELPGGRSSIAAWVEAAAVAAAGAPAALGPDAEACPPLPPPVRLPPLRTAVRAPTQPRLAATPFVPVVAVHAANTATPAAERPVRAASSEPQPGARRGLTSPPHATQPRRQQQQAPRSLRVGGKSCPSSCSSASSSSGRSGSACRRCFQPMAALARLLRF